MMNKEIDKMAEELWFNLGHEDLSDFADLFSRRLAERWAAKCEKLQSGGMCAAMIREDV